eukprot:1317063-Amphidinium_carterae.1
MLSPHMQTPSEEQEAASCLSLVLLASCSSLVSNISIWKKKKKKNLHSWLNWRGWANLAINWTVALLVLFQPHEARQQEGECLARPSLGDADEVPATAESGPRVRLQASVRTSMDGKTTKSGRAKLLQKRDSRIQKFQLARGIPTAKERA